MADPTRYQIYQYVLTATEQVTAQEVAKEFDLHPNVSRMHLSKLTEVELLTAHIHRSGKGGRPGYRYSPSGNSVSLTVSPREFQLLADLLVQSLALLGEGAFDAISQIGRTFGCKLAREAMEAVQGGEEDPQKPMELCAAALQQLGVAAHIAKSAEGAVHLVMRTCGFHGMATTHPEHICLLCKAMVEGITLTCLGAPPSLEQTSSLPKGANVCVYEMSGLIRLE